MNDEKKDILVIGDIFLDEYLAGTVSRISPEAPVPIIQMEDSSSLLSGAANVARNISALDGRVYLVGVIGNDNSGNQILNLLKQSNISIDYIVKSDTYKTITKTRIVGNQQQVARLDYNDNQAITQIEYIKITDMVKQAIPNTNTVVISDYNKGVCSESICKMVISQAKERHKNIIVDPKGILWDKYKGATIITPNLKEISAYIGYYLKNDDECIKKHCITLCSKLSVKYLLITRSEKGMTLIDDKGNVSHFQALTKEVYDVTGAGDTVVATIAASNMDEDIFEAINLSNIAAGIVVQKSGASIVSKSELMIELNRRQENLIEAKVMTLEKLMEYIRIWKDFKESIVFTNGCYDILHKGHIYSIIEASKLGDHLVVGVNSDKSVKKNKGEKRPINSEYDRAYLIAALDQVDAVIIFDDDTPEKIIRMICPDVLAKGSDYKKENVVGKEYAKRVELLPYIDGYSTTSLIRKSQS